MEYNPYITPFLYILVFPAIPVSRPTGASTLGGPASAAAFLRHPQDASRGGVEN